MMKPLADLLRENVPSSGSGAGASGPPSGYVPGGPIKDWQSSPYVVAPRNYMQNYFARQPQPPPRTYPDAPPPPGGPTGPPPGGPPPGGPAEWNFNRYATPEDRVVRALRELLIKRIGR